MYLYQYCTIDYLGVVYDYMTYHHTEVWCLRRRSRLRGILPDALFAIIQAI